ncbi:MAG: aldolase catalytic domain-containing protein [Eubacterium sp.]|nr:aldolase catalytic domain-containing protein [Eubacterium sp.]
MSGISIMDCTLRDGGWINGFEFGKQGMHDILNCLYDSKVEYVELGYIDKEHGSRQGRSMFADMDAIKENGLTDNKREATQLFVMIDYGKYPLEELPECSESGIDGIRLCFHKKNKDDILEAGRIIIDKGYKLIIQPMVCTRYSESEFVQYIFSLMHTIPEIYGFYIVDSFGMMLQEDVMNKVRLADNFLGREVKVGLHTHNNMQLSFQNAITVLDMHLKRDVIVDGTLMGMGKGAGNLNTEIYAEYLNAKCGKDYNLLPLMDMVEHNIRPLQNKYVWGYSAEYFLSAKNATTPSYAKLFYRKEGCSIDEVDSLLKMIPDENRDSFDVEVAEKILEEYKALRTV